MKQQIQQRRFRTRPGLVQRRKLIAGLVVLTGLAINGYAGIKILNDWRSADMASPRPAIPPVDKHRMLSLPLQNTLKNYTWLPDSSHILCFDGHTLFLIEVKSGKRVWVQRSSVYSDQKEDRILWSADHRYIVKFGDIDDLGYPDPDTADIWDLQSRKLIWRSPTPAQRSKLYLPCALAPDGTYLAMCLRDEGAYNNNISTIHIWDIQRNRLYKTLNVQRLRPMTEQTEYFTIKAMAWSPDNTHLALTCSDGTIQTWHVGKGTLMWEYMPYGRETSIQWSPDGSMLALWSYFNMFMMLDAQTGKLRFSILTVSNFGKDYVSKVTNVSNMDDQFMAWSNDAANMALLTYKDNVSYLSVNDAHTGQHRFTCQQVTGQLTGCSWSPDGRYLAAGVVVDGKSPEEERGVRSSIQFWDGRTGKALFSYQAPRSPMQLSWSPNSHSLAAYNPQDYGPLGRDAEFGNFALQVFRVD